MDSSRVNAIPRTMCIGEWALGLDLGSGSVGWAAVSLGSDGRPIKVFSGARIFSSGTDTRNSEAGKEQSRSAERQKFRQMRKQLKRRKARREKLGSLLHRAGLLLDTPESSFKKLQRQVAERCPAGIRESEDQFGKWCHDQMDPYRIRAASLDGPVSLLELGRALFHLSKRRGYQRTRGLSDRKSVEDSGEAEKKGKNAKAKKKEVRDDDEQSMEELLEEQERKLAGGTPAQYLHRERPAVQTKRRGERFRRKHIEDEFNAIWKRQKEYHPQVLTEDLRRKVHDAIFFQRDLKDQSHLIRKCYLEKEEKCAPAWHWLAHEARVLQEVNNIKVLLPESPEEVALTMGQRADVLEALRSEKSVLTFPMIRQIIGRGREKECLNIERGKGKGLKGHLPCAMMREILGSSSLDAKNDFPEIWNCVMAARTKEEVQNFRNLAASKWALSAEQIEALVRINPSGGRSGLSVKALEKIVPFLEQGMLFHDAKERAEYPLPKPDYRGLEFLPPLKREECRNPVVTRVLSETRKVVNELIRTFGKPKRIVVELGRDLRGSIEERNKATIENRKRENQKRKNAESIRPYIDGQEPTRDDLRKYELYLEQGGRRGACLCPYTGKAIKPCQIYSGEVEVDHVLPRRYGIDAFTNLVLAYADANREKGDRTPYEAWAATDPKRYKEMLKRLHAMRMPMNRRRLFRLHRQEDLEAEVEHFAARQLGDTRYAARFVVQRLQMLYPDPQPVPGPVQTTNGRITSILRNEWKLNSLLHSVSNSLPRIETTKRGKVRADHRHHAVDAFVVAMSDEAVRRAAIATVQSRGRDVPLPWPTLIQDLAKSIESIVVSHAPNRKVSGAMLEATNLRREKYRDGLFTSRKKLADWAKSLKPKRSKAAESESADDAEPASADSIVEKLSDIYPPNAKDVVAALSEWAVKVLSRPAKKKKANEDEGGETEVEDHPDIPPPVLPSGIPIKHVRVASQAKAPAAIMARGRIAFTRYLDTGSNHHVAFYESADAKGRPSILIEGCNLLQAYRRVKELRKLPEEERKKKVSGIVRDKHSTDCNAIFLFSLSKGDVVMCRKKAGKFEGQELLHVVTQISASSEGKPNLVFVLHHAAAADPKNKATKQDLIENIRSLQHPLPFRKVHVDPIGRVFPKKGSIRE